MKVKQKPSRKGKMNVTKEMLADERRDPGGRIRISQTVEEILEFVNVVPMMPDRYRKPDGKSIERVPEASVVVRTIKTVKSHEPNKQDLKLTDIL